MSLNLNMSSSTSNMFYGLPSKFDGNSNNYAVWKMQMIALLAMHGLSDYIEKPINQIVGLQRLEEESLSKNANTGEEEKNAPNKATMDQMKLIEETKAKA